MAPPTTSGCKTKPSVSVAFNLEFGRYYSLDQATARRALGVALHLRSAASAAAADTSTIVQIDAIVARNCISAFQQLSHPTPLHTLALLHQAPVSCHLPLSSYHLRCPHTSGEKMNARAWLRLVRSVRRRALDLIRPRHTHHVAACHDSDTARHDRAKPPVNLPLAALPRRQSCLRSRLHGVHYNQREAVITPITASKDIRCRCGDLGGTYRSVPSARRPWATFTCDSLIMSQSLQRLQKDEIPPLLGCRLSLEGTRELY